MSATPALLSFCNVEVSPEGLVESDGKRRLASIPRQEIESVFVLCFGVAALASSLRRGPHLRITTRHGVRKLTFRRDRYYDAQQASAFVDDVRRILSIS